MTNAGGDPESPSAPSRRRHRQPKEKYAAAGSLTPLTERYAIELAVDFSPKKAWERACIALGRPVPKNASASGWNALRNPRVQEAAAKARAAGLLKAGITVEKTEQEIARLAYVDIVHYFDANNCLKRLSEIPEDARRAIVSVETDEIYEFSESEEIVARLDQAENLIADLLACMPKEVPAGIATQVKALEKWARPKKKGDKRDRYLIGYTRKVKLADKKGALELAGKRDGIFRERVEHNLSPTLETILAESWKT